MRGRTGVAEVVNPVVEARTRLLTLQKSLEIPYVPELNEFHGRESEYAEMTQIFGASPCVFLVLTLLFCRVCCAYSPRR